MEGRREPPSFNSDYGFNTPICEEELDDDEQIPYHNFSQDRQQAPKFSLNVGRQGRLAAVLLGLLAAVLLMVNIGLGVYYNTLTDTHLTVDDTKQIGNEITAIQGTFKMALEAMKKAKEKQNTELNLQKQTQWELEHQTERGEGYKTQIDKITSDIAKLRPHLPMIRDGCKYCPTGWIWMNSRCLYFPNTPVAGVKSWQKAREFCQLHGGDLMVIDSKEKQNVTVTYLLSQRDQSQPLSSYWVGLKLIKSESSWKWVDGTELDEGYWDSAEPGEDSDENCAAAHAAENFFKAWRDYNCRAPMKWICEKTPDKIL